MFIHKRRRDAYEDQDNTALKLAAGDKYASGLEHSLGLSKREQTDLKKGNSMLGLLDQIEEELERMGEQELPEDEAGDPDSSPTQAAYEKIDQLLRQLRDALDEYDKLTNK